MEVFEKMWDLHFDRPEIYHKVRDAVRLMVKSRNHGGVDRRRLLESYLIILEHCGDFQCQATVLTLILSDGTVQLMKDWLAVAWFKDMPKTLAAFLNLEKSHSVANYCEFLNTYNNELESQYLLSVHCCLARWNDSRLPVCENSMVWLHLNCGTRTISVTGIEEIPLELNQRNFFVLKPVEIKKVQVDIVVSSILGRVQHISISTTRGNLSLVADPPLEDWGLFKYFVKFIAKVDVEFKTPDMADVNLPDYNENLASEPSRNDEHISKPHGNLEVNNFAAQHKAQNSVFQVSSSQDDAMKSVNQGEAPMQLCSDTENNDIEVCHHFKLNKESCNDSETADESFDGLSVSADTYSKNDRTQEINLEVDPSLIAGDTSASCTVNWKPVLEVASAAANHDEGNENAPNSAEQDNGSNGLLHLVAPEVEQPQQYDLGGDLPSSEPIAAIGNDDCRIKRTPGKFQKRRKLGRTKKYQERRVRMTPKTFKQVKAIETGNNDDCLAATPRLTRSYTQRGAEVLPEENWFKTPSELPIKTRRQSTCRKRKSDGLVPTCDDEKKQNLSSAMATSIPVTQDSTFSETSPDESKRCHEDSGTFSVLEETLEPPKVPHPQSMPTLLTPFATPVRDQTETAAQPDLSHVHEKLNEGLKLEILMEASTYMPPGPLPPTAIPIHPNSSYRLKVRPFHTESDVDLKNEDENMLENYGMDSSSDASYLDNAASAVLLPMEDGGLSTLCSSPANNLQRFSEICSKVNNNA